MGLQAARLNSDKIIFKNGLEIVGGSNQFQLYDHFLGIKIDADRWDWTTDALGNVPEIAIQTAAPGGKVLIALEATNEEQHNSLNNGHIGQISLANIACFHAKLAVTTAPTGVAEAFWGLAGGSWANGKDGPDIRLSFAMETDDVDFLPTNILFNIDDGDTDSGWLDTGKTTGTYFDIDVSNLEDIIVYIDGQRILKSTKLQFLAGDAYMDAVFGVYKASGVGLGAITADLVGVI